LKYTLLGGKKWGVRWLSEEGSNLN